MPFDRPIKPSDEEAISAKIQALEERILLTGFVLPGMTQGSASLDVARTVLRRAERRIVALSRKEPVSSDLMRLVNRLSDYIFMLARAEEKAAGAIRFS